MMKYAWLPRRRALSKEWGVGVDESGNEVDSGTIVTCLRLFWR